MHCLRWTRLVYDRLDFRRVAEETTSRMGLGCCLGLRPHRVAWGALVFAVLGSAAPSYAQPDLSQVLADIAARLAAQEPRILSADPQTSDRGTIPPGSVIAEVRIKNEDIFNPEKPGENNWIFRLANKLHIATRPKVIERQLLFKPGDVFSPELIEESARILRTNDYFYDVAVQPKLRPDGKVDVDVVTRDVWTLQAGAGFSRAGGENTTTFQLQDTNFFGSGKEVTISRIGTLDRTSNLMRYRDPNLFGRRLQMTLSYAENSDGGRERFELERPFYSLDSRWAAGLRALRDDRVERLFKSGKPTDGFRHQHSFLEVYGGFSPGLVDDVARRVRFGFTFSQDDFTRAPGLPRGVVPADRTLAYPWVGYESIENRFVVERDFDRIDRSEDVHVGRQWSALLGYSTQGLGGFENLWIAQTAGSAAFRPGPRQMLRTNFGASTRWGADGTENLVAGGRIRYYARNLSGRHLFYAALGADMAYRLDDEDQLLLGGDSGLRGYPVRYQAGDRRLLLTLEQRFFTGIELFHLVHLGGAVFFDAGHAWFVGSHGNPGSRSTAAEETILKDIGLGLRLGSSRSSRGAVVHLDVAFPLDRIRGIESVQWVITTSESF